jgi:hypothetical protein
MTRTAVFVIREKSGVTRLLFVDFGEARSPQAFADRINERQGIDRSVELLGMEDELSPELLKSFAVSQRAATLETAQSMALKGAWCGLAAKAARPLERRMFDNFFD